MLNLFAINSVSSVRFDVCVYSERISWNSLILALQNAPLSEQQQAAILTLSHAVAERPFPHKLVSFQLSFGSYSIMYTSLV